MLQFIFSQISPQSSGFVNALKQPVLGKIYHTVVFEYTFFLALLQFHYLLDIACTSLFLLSLSLFMLVFQIQFKVTCCQELLQFTQIKPIIFVS